MGEDESSKTQRNVRDLLTKRGSQRVTIGGSRRGTAETIESERSQPLESPVETEVVPEESRAATAPQGLRETPGFSKSLKPDVRAAIPGKISKSALRRQFDSNAVGKLSVMPLAVLLPRMGDITQIQLRREAIESRFVELRSALAASSAESPTENASEEVMLNQVMQWLSLGESD